MHTKCKNLVAEILELAGVKINGSNPWDIQIHNDEFYRRAITEGELGIGESYMNGWWDAENIDQFIYKILVEQLDEKIQLTFSILFKIFTSQLINLQSKRRAFIIGEKHYDLGNDLLENMLQRNIIVKLSELLFQKTR